MVEQQIETLVSKVIELSRSDKVAWEETADKDTFLASLSKFVVTIARIDDSAYATYYKFTVVDQTGKLLEEVNGSTGSMYVALKDLHDLARRRALHVDAQLTELLSSLERI